MLKIQYWYNTKRIIVTLVLPENIGKVKKSNCVKFSRYYKVTQRVFINSFDPNIIDIGSGNESSERSQYQRMLNDCRNKKLNTIITKSISRFGRNTVEVISAVRELRNLGINIIFESENLDTRDSSNEFLISILSGLAEAENESRRLNIIWRLEKQAKNGTSELYRRRCYGYKKDKIGNLTINESEAETVRFIFSSYIAGKSYKQISKELAENGISSPTGKSTWCNKGFVNKSV